MSKIYLIIQFGGGGAGDAGGGGGRGALGGNHKCYSLFPISHYVLSRRDDMYFMFMSRLYIPAFCV